ncbi:leucine-rich repeat domain-containing protein [Bariatricus massiliensis]|uniref:Leucine-rich repeat domain-containing protein n=1 Tax=Bariatricus massiliensis TaxID=1745713 RepID=A0ABS8DJH5_9FIRM|nr:leucine-rich repeat domain-containing protein [Bariatricus massiliensis]MCB7305181.1 leucine-rich repeat domain-containing protein [Bariatricus massiliensis]MCB7375711.1 leucine-rich repeat domain-containing protein [Bariatricus massiliensis]MCB7388324.1 leucine-rich repeat domain-containing protein [Bariatricus massiliensis]MCB7412473.1 leucine-rich repeat domain-containing protein [Bariatricus massiliensis]MCQ5254133.1 leucine-rich repeat domain-containing protein [Bariatricus massiliensi
MRIHYRKIEQGVQLVRLWGQEGTVKVPESIAGEPIVEIAPYAFSARKDCEDLDVLIWEDESCEEYIFGDDLSILCGENIQEIHLPEYVRKIGNYAFYGCRNLRLFHATDRLVSMGSGVFTGCRLSEVQIDFYDGEQSCLKEILTEIRYEVRAVLCCHGDKNAVAKVLFPEYYADAVENTPARIVETHYYGSGGDYRECFYRKQLDFEKYDSMFILSQARDEISATASLAVGRLLYPYRLSDSAKAVYQEYLRTHMAELVAVWLETLREESAAILDYCCREHLFTEQTLEAALHTAMEHGQAEIAGILMDERRRLGVRRKKVFEL